MEFAKQIPDLGALKKVYRFDKSAYLDQQGRAVENVPFDLFAEWWRAFATGFLCSYRGTEPIAVFGLFPVTSSWAKGFLARTVSEFDLNGKVIKEGEKDRIAWYLSGISSDRTAANEVGARLACILGYSLSEWVRFNAAEIGTRPISIVAEGTSLVGQKLLLKVMRFELRNPGTSSDEKPRFLLETRASEIVQALNTSAFFKRCRTLQGDIKGLGS